MNTSPTTTVTRHMMTALAVALAVLAVVIVVGTLALNWTNTAKSEVITRDARIVINAHRLDLGLSDGGIAIRNFLMTGDEDYLASLEDADTRYDEAFATLSEIIRDPTSRDLLDEISEAREDHQAEVDGLIEERRAGALSLEQTSQAIDLRLTPAREQVAGPIGELIAVEEQGIRESVASANSTAALSRWLVLAIGVVGAGFALAIGARAVRIVGGQLTEMALSVDAAASEILASTAQHAAGAAQQATSVQEVVTTVDELEQTAGQSAERARGVADHAETASEVAARGDQAVAETAEAMEDINRQVGAITEAVTGLSQRAQAISGIVATVEDIADQVHLLALNASIEAARAGEHGRGFSVVANEVRSLADQSKRATEQITALLGEIQQSTHSAVMATEQGARSVLEGVERIDIAGSTIAGLAETVAQSAIAAEQIAASSGQQAVATSQISQAMRDLEGVTQQSAAAARQAEQAARDLNAVALELKALVGAE